MVDIGPDLHEGKQMVCIRPDLHEIKKNDIGPVLHESKRYGHVSQELIYLSFSLKSKASRRFG